jgi:hypothetical protein
MNDTRESCRKLPLKAVLVAEFKNKRGGEQEGWDCLVVEVNKKKGGIV